MRYIQSHPAPTQGEAEKPSAMTHCNFLTSRELYRFRLPPHISPTRLVGFHLFSLLPFNAGTRFSESPHPVNFCFLFFNFISQITPIYAPFHKKKVKPSRRDALPPFSAKVIIIYKNPSGIPEFYEMMNNCRFKP